MSSITESIQYPLPVAAPTTTTTDIDPELGNNRNFFVGAALLALIFVAASMLLALMYLRYRRMRRTVLIAMATPVGGSSRGARAGGSRAGDGDGSVSTLPRYETREQYVQDLEVGKPV
ncbi:hypothetical protein EDC01DRAFT_636159 [Geopyxis carbonaria]|nr:hypothetical protein EDC01DRAFT_636159 [Geopyxis carbonaria]